MPMLGRFGGQSGSPSWPPRTAPSAPAVPAPPRQIPVVFWGICDVKYDPRLPPQDRVKVLELGDGRSSRFSHHGKDARTRFETEYCFAQSPIKRAVLVENKRLTHDRFLHEGFKHLRPRAGCYVRRYTPELAAQICDDLEARSGNVVVLKLCNRSRGAGVVAVPAARLDETLRQLLTPPGTSSDASADSEKELELWLRKRRPNALSVEQADSFEEHCLHWWSNECPVFVAEQCCHSLPVVGSEGDAAGKRFDATLRVVFTLRHSPSTFDETEGDGGSQVFVDKQSREAVEPFQVNWLGGYWKLPRTACEARDDADTGNSLEDVLEETRAKLVSSFNTAEKRTEKVAQEHLDEVCDALTPALPRVFQAGALAVQNILQNYKREPLLCAFTLARSAAAIRITRMSKAQGLLELARGMVQPPQTQSADTVPERAVLSYITRNLGVGQMMQQRWREAAALLTVSLQLLPTNATAHYVQGMLRQEQKYFTEAAESLLQALALDPDFKLPYLALGNCWLHLGSFAEVLQVSRACLHRHPDTPAVQFNIGLALYHMVHAGTVPLEELDGVCEQAKDTLGIAKRRLPDLWHPTDEAILQYFLADAERRKSLPRQPVRTRQVFGWRP